MIDETADFIGTLRRPEDFIKARARLVKLAEQMPTILDALRIAETIARHEYEEAE